MAQCSEGSGRPVGLIGPVPPPYGGMAMQTRQLVTLLQESDVAVEFLATNGPYRPAWMGHIPVLRALARLLPYFWSVWQLAGRCRVIHLMANSGWSWHLFAAPVLFIAPLRGTPVIVNYRGGEAGEFFRRSIRWVRPFMNRAAAIVVPSAYLQQVFESFGWQAEVVPNIIDRRLFHPADAPPTQSEVPQFVITRNLERIYGIETAIEALAICRTKGLTATLEVAGSGPDEQRLKQRCKELGVESCVHFLGRLERADVIALYHRAFAMINPTTVDNMPNSVLESLACGVPVISSNVGGVPFIVTDEETALLVPVGDAQALADAMERLMTDEKLVASITESGCESIRNYEWPQVAPRWLSVYATAASS